ncbi:MAG: biotin synthase BioB [Candidatus Omnitrophota bacterium]
MGNILDLFLRANSLREKHHKNKVSLCAIVNAKSGLCAQDCKFCSQSLYHKTNIRRYPLLSAEEILKYAKQASRIHATCFGIVTSGKSTDSAKELDTICRALKLIKKNLPRLKRSASLGMLGSSELLALKKAGLERYHHNLETSERFFPKICTTHTHDKRLATIRSAKALGLEVCSGGIFGMGETVNDRVSLAKTLKRFDVDSIPLNFLNPIKGTTLANKKPMPPLEILKTIALFRINLPKADIKVCGGRNMNLRMLQSMIFFAGANGMMIGNYLTTAGNDPRLDLQMIKDLGLKIRNADGRRLHADYRR